jgi:putative Mg2+ transporter-C (MgtC) family protein
MQVLRMLVSDEPGLLGEIASLIASHGASIRKVNIDEDEKDEHVIDLTFIVQLPEKLTITDLVEEIRKVKGLKSIRNE